MDVIYMGNDFVVGYELLEEFKQKTCEEIRNELLDKIKKVAFQHSCGSCGLDSVEQAWIDSYNEMALKMYNAIKTGIPLTKEEWHEMAKEAVKHREEVIDMDSDDYDGER